MPGGQEIVFIVCLYLQFLSCLRIVFFAHNYNIKYSYLNTNDFPTVGWFQVFLVNINNLNTVLWYKFITINDNLFFVLLYGFQLLILSR